MDIAIASQASQRHTADAIILPFWQHKKNPTAACDLKEFAALYALPVDAGDFKGKEAEVLFLYDAHQKEKRVVLLGLGEKEKCTSEILRRVYSNAVKAVLRKKCKSLNILLPKCDHACKSICEGVLLTNYKFDQLKGESLKEDPSALLTKVTFIGADKKELAMCEEAKEIIASVYFARDLVNGNADDITPQKLSQAAKELQKHYKKIHTTVFDKKQIEKEGMGLLLAVNRGASNDPAFIILKYEGDPRSKERTAIIGKGITYDTGGLNLKTSGMETMKADMGGAAAVLGTLRAAAALDLKVNLVGVIASTENAIGPDSYKPGDVYKGYSGKTVEISNTDAEGRLVLADALAYTEANLSPTRMIDLATLTGGVVVALGEEISGVFSDNAALIKGLVKAGEETHEIVWPLPLVKDYKEMLKSPYADLKNSAGRKASPITAALFLQQFVKDTPWAHIDIAGPAFLSEPKFYYPTPGTGFGVRLLIEFLKQK